jgi:diamine N-acetyltransferase
MLRQTELADIPFVVATESQPENARYVRQWDADIHRRALVNGDIQHLVVQSLNDSRQLGFIILWGLKIGDSTIELKRIVVADKRRGVGRRAIGLIKQFVFSSLHRNRLWLEVLPENVVAKNLYLSEGFISQGWSIDPTREHRFQNLEILSINRPDVYQTVTTS